MGKTDNKQLKKVVVASMIGSVAEWYEFFLYGTASALVFGELFFQQTGSAIDGILAAFALYAVGFLARPIGGLVFGHYGDKFGRKNLLQLSLIIVGITTFLMGCIPTFSSIGYWAPILLVTLRLIQGFAFGGEWGGAVILVSEHSPSDRRGYWASWPQAGVPLGNLIATIILLLLSKNLSPEQFMDWGWRVAFWFSAVVVLIGLWIRKSVDDAPIFKESQEKQAQLEKQQLGIIEVIRDHKKAIIAGIGARFAENILYYIVVTFSISYLKLAVNKDTSQILLLMFGAHAIHFFLIPLMGHLSDVWGRKPIYMTGAVLTAFWGFIGFPMMDTGNDWLIITAITIGLFIQSMTYSPYSALMTELFPTHIRYTALSLCYQVAPILAGSLAPLISLSLLNKFNSSIPISIYLVISSIISISCIMLVKETKGKSLTFKKAK
ncbi:fosfomycin efflux MFS transporter AbaF [Bacillus paramycoides]|uniref:Putative proline/betaine transporter n=1 Tax=Bacillus paramycoides TaxID=2026194 RepID=A0A1J9UI63_9BACI|nr:MULTISPECIES: fosfomycin efflux MFS transporter AbaF [Bacillus]MED1410784.1 fosfomycin efflux MFS transporter AbaF [Bacillus paramycoides]MED1464028.1 fosfomycin efflux MFS transporter AbaF [Bacillus paramycoides]MED1492179.1 fosfomycin efflux MFS transporter AbaF [Bacillus paramycoides]MED1565864.1 fosfomycin efflux MFS transporter AbaF [Bacillus paramycoides]OJD77753.1 MFS transporter permease [Bacillus paramycoides]